MTHEIAQEMKFGGKFMNGIRVLIRVLKAGVKMLFTRKKSCLIDLLTRNVEGVVVRKPNIGVKHFRSLNIIHIHLLDRHEGRFNMVFINSGFIIT